MTTKTGTFEDFKEFTLAIARGERRVGPGEPKVWVEDAGDGTAGAAQFRSLEAGAKLLSAKNRELLRLIAVQEPQSVQELATMANRAPQNVQRTLRRMSAAGIVRLQRGEGRALRPVLAVRKVHFEIDLAG